MRVRLEVEFKKYKVDEESVNRLKDAREELEAGFKKNKVNELYKILSNGFPKNLDVIYYDDFYVSGRALYFDGKDHDPLTINRCLRPIVTLIRKLKK